MRDWRYGIAAAVAVGLVVVCLAACDPPPPPRLDPFAEIFEAIGAALEGLASAIMFIFFMPIVLISVCMQMTLASIVGAGSLYADALAAEAEPLPPEIARAVMSTAENCRVDPAPILLTGLLPPGLYEQQKQRMEVPSTCAGGTGDAQNGGLDFAPCAAEGLGGAVTWVAEESGYRLDLRGFSALGVRGTGVVMVDTSEARLRLDADLRLSGIGSGAEATASLTVTPGDPLVVSGGGAVELDFGRATFQLRNVIVDPECASAAIGGEADVTLGAHRYLFVFDGCDRCVKAFDVARPEAAPRTVCP